MILSRRKFTQEFKLAAVRQLEAGKTVGEVARGFEVAPNLLHRWRREWRDHPGQVCPGVGRRMVQENREAELERKIGQLTMEVDFFKKVLRRFEEQRQEQAVNGGKPCTSRSPKK